MYVLIYCYQISWRVVHATFCTAWQLLPFFNLSSNLRVDDTEEDHNQRHYFISFALYICRWQEQCIMLLFGIFSLASGNLDQWRPSQHTRALARPLRQKDPYFNALADMYAQCGSMKSIHGEEMEQRGEGPMRARRGAMQVLRNEVRGRLQKYYFFYTVLHLEAFRFIALAYQKIIYIISPHFYFKYIVTI